VCCIISSSVVRDLLCVAVWCSVLQCVAVCCSVLQCVAVCCSLLQYVAVWTLHSHCNGHAATHCNTIHSATFCNAPSLPWALCDTHSVLQSVAECPRQWECVAVCCRAQHTVECCSVLQSAHCSVLQCVMAMEVCCSVMQSAAHCRVLHCVASAHGNASVLQCVA